MTGLDAIAARAAASHLAIFGALHSEPGDGSPEGCGTLILLGPAEPGFWAHVTAEAEFNDGAPDPLDRWSARVIGALAAALGGEAIFPSDGPPYAPFFTWAMRSGRAWSSPVTLLVQETAGLMVSYRGAIALPDRLDLPDAPAKPCDTCAAPCATACPVGALTPDGYDLDACHAYLDSPAGQDCMTQGCAVRRACPVSQSYGRVPEQSAYHMSLFHT